MRWSKGLVGSSPARGTTFRVNTLNDQEAVTPTEVPTLPGFFYYPDDDRLCVNRHGEVRNSKTGKTRKGYVSESTGSRIFFVTSPDKKSQTHSHHRIVARTFIGRPARHVSVPFEELEVNHVNGIRHDNAIENLEWVSRVENVHHAHLSGFHEPDRPVVAFNPKTEKVLWFHSLKACAEAFRIHRATLYKHLKKGLGGTKQKDGFFFKYDDDTQFVIEDPHEAGSLGSGVEHLTVLVKDRVSKKTFIVSNLKQAAELTGIKYGRLYRSLKKTEMFLDTDYEIRLSKSNGL